MCRYHFFQAPLFTLLVFSSLIASFTAPQLLPAAINVDSLGAVPRVAADPVDNRYHPYLDDGTFWRRDSQIKWPRLSVIVGAFLVFDAFGFAKISDLQYNTQTTTFHFHEGSRDIREYKQMDKVGHMVEAYYISHIASKVYRWGGMSAPRSIWYGSLTGFVWMLQIEITDGFYKAWGFSYYDLTMNILGAGYAALQQFYPEQLKGIRFKVSYYPSQAYKRGLYSTVSKSWLDDYEGFNFWLAVNPYDVMPRSWKSSVPGWLAPWGIALGYGVQDIATDVFNGHREFVIGLDLDLNKIPTGNNRILKFWKDEFNIFRLPLPAVRISPTTVWYGFYFAM
jgi:hypothetical protein